MHPRCQKRAGWQARRSSRVRPDAAGTTRLAPQQPHLPAQTPHHVCHPGGKDQAANRKEKGSKDGRPAGHEADSCKRRNTAERLINKLRARRGVATRYDKTPKSCFTGLHLRAANDLDQGPHPDGPPVTIDVAQPYGLSAHKRTVALRRSSHSLAE